MTPARNLLAIVGAAAGALAVLLATAAALAVAGGPSGGGELPVVGGPLPATTARASEPPPPAIARRVLTLTASAPRVGYEVRFAGPRPGVRAQADRRRRVIHVFVRPGDATHRVAHDLAHELGHAVDDRRLSEAERAAYLARRGAPHGAWWPRGARSDLSSGAGDFAEVFARCHAPSPDFRSRLASAPADACAMLPREARPR